MARTEITPLLVSTSDESADSRSMSRGNSTGMTPDTYHTNAIIRAFANSSIWRSKLKEKREPANLTASPLARCLSLSLISRSGDLTKTRELHSTNYLSAGVSAAERPIVTTEQPANLAGTGVTKQGALARPLAYPVVIGSL